MPASIKDLILTAGWPTLRGSKTVDSNQPWDEDAPAVARPLPPVEGPSIAAEEPPDDGPAPVDDPDRPEARAPDAPASP